MSPSQATERLPSFQARRKSSDELIEEEVRNRQAAELPKLQWQGSDKLSDLQAHDELPSFSSSVGRDPLSRWMFKDRTCEMPSFLSSGGKDPVS